MKNVELKQFSSNCLTEKKLLKLLMLVRLGIIVVAFQVKLTFKHGISNQDEDVKRHEAVF